MYDLLYFSYIVFFNKHFEILRGECKNFANKNIFLKNRNFLVKLYKFTLFKMPKHLNINIEMYEKNAEIILWKISRIINEDERIALIWPNGAGKSTFMKIISGQILDFVWNIENIGNMSIWYLEQIHFNDETKTIRDELRDAFTEIREIEKQLQIAETKMEETWEFEEFTDLQERYGLLWGYTYDNEVEKVARGIGIFHLLEKTLSEVSGGERTKIALAKILLSKPNFLLLDEPTNFIDLPSMEWLEKYLTETWKGGYLIVSHDREFLDETCTTVIDMLGIDGIKEYTWTYSDSVAEKAKLNAIEEKKFEEQQTFIESEKKLINRFRAGSRASFAKSRERALDKVEILEKPKTKREIKFSFPYDKYGPEVSIKIEDAFIGRSEPLFFIREANLHRGERIGIVGENGVWKSTLIKTILKTIKPLEGMVQVHDNARILYFSQLHETLDTQKTISENFSKHGLEYTNDRIGGIIQQYWFDFLDYSKKVSSLSGWERSRLLFALLWQNAYASQTAKNVDSLNWANMDEVLDISEKNYQEQIKSDYNNLFGHQYEKSENSNLLILDEPTNHLDADTRESLEKALSEYKGAILFISHDRYFVNKLATKLWIIEDGELSISYGNYEDYQFKKERWIDFDMSLFDLDGEMDLVLEEKLWAAEARRIKEKFSRKKAGRKR